MDQIKNFRSRLERTVFSPIVKTGNWYYRIVALLCIIIGWGMFAYVVQVRRGLIVTGMSDRISWGIYIILFVFVIAISYGGTIISAVLRMTDSGWRSPITRMAEFITVAALVSGTLFVIIDMGRPDRVHHLMLFGRWQSPIIWDVIAVNTYLIGSIIYLYLPLIPDMARCRDRLATQVPGWKHRIFSIAALNWRGTPEQKRYLEKAMFIMMISIVPVAIMVHTVLSWIFAMTLREPWNSPMFGIYFVTGAVFSGVAAVVIIMALFRKIYHLEEYIKRKHFAYLGYILFILASAMMYFNFNEFLVAGYKLAGEEGLHLRNLFLGHFAPLYWAYALGGLLIPAILIIVCVRLLPKFTIAGVVTGSILITIGMWLERYIIVVAGLQLPLMPYDEVSYTPTWAEISIMAGVFALFALVLAIFVKIFPVLAMWEVEEHYEKQSEKDAEES